MEILVWIIIGINIGTGICYVAQKREYKINPSNPDIFEKGE